MHPTTVDDLHAALLCLQQEKHFELGIINTQTAEMAYDLGVQIRKQYPKQLLPLIMLGPAERPSEKVTKQEFSAYLSKPVKPSHLFDAIMIIFSVTGQHQTAPAAKTQPTLNASLAQQFPLRILVVEDNTINQRLAQRILQKMGFRPDLVSNGLEAITVISQQHYDIVFMDVQMPEMDGIQATEYIVKNTSVKQRPKIIAMTANAMQGDREQCLEAGMDDYISKPIRVEQLQKTLIQWGQRILA